MRAATLARLSILAWCCCAAATSATGSNPLAYPNFYPADAVRGKALASACLACHGPAPMIAGSAGFHVPKLGGQRASSVFDALLEYKNGQRHSDLMAPIAAGLSLQDLRDVAMYLAGVEVKPSPAPLPESPAHTRVHNDCAGCHGETGLGVMPGIPVIGGQYADYLVHALEAFKNGERSNETMGIMARALSEEEIHELAAYFEEREYLRAGP